MFRGNMVLNLAAWIPVFVLVVAGCTYAPYIPAGPAFSGDSSNARGTVVLATLDSPMPKGKNAVWCGTVKLAYDAWKAGFGPVPVESARETVARLDAATLKAGDLPEGSYYVAAGTDKDGILKKIRSDMARKFPQASPNLPGGAPGDFPFVAYCYLSANVKFRHPYFDRDAGDEFTDSSGKKTQVSSFGLYKQPDAAVNDTLADQIDVLYSDQDYSRAGEFVLDLDKSSRPSQLILACVEPKETLAATWQDVLRKIGGPTKPEPFDQYDHLAVPNVAYKLQHHFKEFETDKQMLVFQSIDFRLDKSGAALASDSYFAAGARGRDFSFTRPFLIAMRKRGSIEPYFVMWVDNAELLGQK